MIRHLPRKAIAAALGLLPLAALMGVTPAAADSGSQSASIVVNDTGYNPRSVTIFLGGTVSFTNGGGIVHTATSTGGPLPFDTGGLNPGQATSFNYSLSGTYPFNSATDCLNGNNSTQFNCGGGTITVLAAGAPATAPAPGPAAPAPVAPGAAPASAPGAPQGSASVTIDDKGMTPAAVNITLGGTVTWVNQSGSLVHTATTTGNANPVPFDTGGLGPGQSGTLTFGQAGTYTYTSSPDCQDKSNPGSFGCGPYTVNVGATPGPAAPAPTGGASAQPVVSNTNVTIGDSNGFAPNTLTIHTGQTVIWTNKGNNVHTASSNPGYVPTFDSGGMATGQSYSFQFTQQGTYGYHSQTEPVYGTDTNGNVTVAYQFNGTIVVQ